MSRNEQIGTRIPKSLIFVTPIALLPSDSPPLSSPGLPGSSWVTPDARRTTPDLLFNIFLVTRAAP
eukprot:718738-Karenia_brevis.AAC.1